MSPSLTNRYVPRFGFRLQKGPNVWVLVAIFTVLGLLIVGCVVDFIPASGFKGQRGVVVFGALGVFLTVLVYRDMFKREQTSARQASWKIWLVSPGVAAMLGAFAWVVVVKAVPWSITRTFGSDHQLQAMMETDHVYSTRMCDHRLKGGPLVNNFPPFVCISPDCYQRHPDQMVMIELRGKATPLGFAIISVHHLTSGEHAHAD